MLDLPTKREIAPVLDVGAGESQQGPEINGPFIQIPLEVLHDNRLLPLEKLLIGQLLGEADGRCSVMVEMVAAELGTSRENARKMLSHLLTLGGF